MSGPWPIATIEAIPLGIPPGLDHMTASAWDSGIHPWPMEGISDDWQILTITGTSVGCGKTHLATAIFRELIEDADCGLFLRKPYSPTGTLPARWEAGPIWLSAPALAAALMPNGILDGKTHLVHESPLLLLDDLGTERDTPFARGAVIETVVARHAMGTRTILTTNLQGAGVVEYDSRLASRLMDRTRSIVVKLKGSDQRRRVTAIA